MDQTSTIHSVDTGFNYSALILYILYCLEMLQADGK